MCAFIHIYVHVCHCSTSKVEHHLSVISNIQNRFRRDKSVKNQMTSHDENIHRFERCLLSLISLLLFEKDCLLVTLILILSAL